jgi:HEAT repeat protein
LLLMFVSLVCSVSSRAVEAAPAEEPIYQGKTLAEWIDDLNDLQRDRRSTARALAVFGAKKEVVSALAAALTKEADEGFVIAVAETLGKFGPKAKDALPALRASFKFWLEAPRGDKEGEEHRKRICRTLAEALVLMDDHPGPEFAPILLAALETDDTKKRRDIVIRLGKLGPDAAKTTVPALIALLEHTKRGGWGAGYVPQPVGAIVPSQQEVCLEAAKSLGRIGPAAKPALHALTLALKNAAPEKNAVVRSMEVSDKPAGSADAKVRTISFTLVTGDKEMLRACAEALGRIRPEAKGTAAALRLALRDLDEGVRWAALCALLESGQDTREVAPILRDFLGDKDAACRRVAVEALGKSGTDSKPIIAALKDDDASVRESAAKTLGDRKDEAKQAIPALIVALKDANAKVRAEAAEALGKIGVANEEVVAALIAALDDKEDNVMATAAAALAKFGARAKAAIPPLVARLQNSDPMKRGGVCIILAKFGPTAKEAIPALEKMTRDDSKEIVRLAAFTALARIDSSRLKDTVPRLVDALQSRDAPESVNEKVREVSLECLTFLGPDARDALPALRRLHEDTNEQNGWTTPIDNAIEAIEGAKKKPAER